MAGSIFGKNFTVTTFGESHGEALGLVIDGCPAGLELSKEDIMPFMNRRKPGQSQTTTSRNENDEIEILSGIFEGKTTGCPIGIIIRNNSQRSSDYNNIKDIYRPGHADFCFDKKFGLRDYRGGGRSSGRETASRVAAGAVAIKILKELGIEVIAFTNSIGNVEIANFNKNEIFQNSVYMPDKEAAKEAEQLILNLKTKADSIGGSVKIIIKGLKAGVGEPVFDKLDAALGKAMFSIGAVKAVEIGEGIKASHMKGSENNDSIIYKDGNIEYLTNHSGGILGGISNSNDITIKVYFKPTPSISQKQNTINNKNENCSIEIKGRHDPTVVPRAVVVCETMAALTTLDLIMSNTNSKLSSLKNAYESFQE